jgi:hypothetical protein
MGRTYDYLQYKRVQTSLLVAKDSAGMKGLSMLHFNIHLEMWKYVKLGKIYIPV